MNTPTEPRMKIRTDILVAGAGISGLSAAYTLHQKNAEVHVVHAGQEAGGAVQTVHKQGWILETGPNTIVLTNTYLKELISSLNLSDSLIEANPVAKNRYVVKHKTLQALPGSLMKFLQTPLFSIKAKLRLFKEPFIAKGTQANESLADFVRRRLGDEFLDYAINPFVAGVYAGNPENLSTRLAFPMLHVLEQKYGSLIKGQFQVKPEDRKPGDLPRSSAPMITFKKGNKELIDALTGRLHGKLTHQFEIQTIRKLDASNPNGHVYEVEDKAGRIICCRKLVLTLPLFALQNISWQGFASDMVEGFSQVEYPPLTVVHLGYRKEQVDHKLEGFGLLVPEAEGLQILGCLFNSSLFPGRSPDEEHILLTCFIGGSRKPEYAREADDQILKRVTEDTGLLLGIKGPPTMHHITRWPRAIPQYSTTYDVVYEHMNHLEGQNKGLYYLGNFKSGISVPDCARNGVRLAEQLLDDADA